MSTNNSIHNPGQTGQTITRRDVLKALSILPAAALLPALQNVEFSTVEPPTFRTGLTELIIKLAAFDAYLHALANHSGPVDAEALYQRYGEASEASMELDRLIVSVEFEQTILGPLAGGIERYHGALKFQPDEAIIPVEPSPKYQEAPKPSPEKLRKAYEEIEAVIADLKAKLA